MHGVGKVMPAAVMGVVQMGTAAVAVAVATAVVGRAGAMAAAVGRVVAMAGVVGKVVAMARVERVAVAKVAEKVEMAVWVSWQRHRRPVGPHIE